MTRHAWRLTPLLAPLLLLLGVLADALGERAGAAGRRRGAGRLARCRISSSRSCTYGLLTIAAVAGAAVFLQERALKAKQPTALTRLLPAVAESETLEVGFLAAAEAVLALGVASGMAAEHFLHGALLPFDHKTVLSLAAFVVIGGLLVARRVNGIRGRRVARLGAARLSAADPGLSGGQVRDRCADDLTCRNSCCIAAKSVVILCLISRHNAAMH